VKQGVTLYVAKWTRKDALMSLPPKTVECKCGNTMTVTQKTNWCNKCMKQVFYHAKDQRLAKYDNLYMWAVVISVIFFLSYVFIELIAGPLMSFK
jgi:hypothetical protein